MKKVVIINAKAFRNNAVKVVVTDCLEDLLIQNAVYAPFNEIVSIAEATDNVDVSGYRSTLAQMCRKYEDDWFYCPKKDLKELFKKDLKEYISEVTGEDKYNMPAEEVLKQLVEEDKLTSETKLTDSVREWGVKSGLIDEEELEEDFTFEEVASCNEKALGALEEVDEEVKQIIKAKLFVITHNNYNYLFLDRTDMESDLEEFYECAGFEDFYNRVLKDMNDEQIVEYYKKTFEHQIY